MFSWTDFTRQEIRGEPPEKSGTVVANLWHADCNRYAVFHKQGHSSIPDFSLLLLLPRQQPGLVMLVIKD